MHQLYLEDHPHESCCRESYRKVFEEKFNVAFGYPRKDTCSKCDEFTVELVKNHPTEKLRTIHIERELHLRKGQTFYNRKTEATCNSELNDHVAAVAFDFWKNLPSPNTTTNDTYYKRQLSLYTFNIHVLASNNVYLYTYDETIGKKGANEVTSMLMHFVTNFLPPHVTHVKFFCDSCAGQNKNWTMFRFLHHLAHKRKRFEEVKITFPIRGHSYMECDRDMVPVNQKLQVETPAGWMDHFKEARRNPSPFNVVPVKQDMLLNIDRHIGTSYFASCPVKTQPLREVVFSSKHPRLMLFRESWNGAFSSAVVCKPVGKRRIIQAALTPSNTTLLPLPAPKYKDLMVLNKFVSQGAADFFTSLPHQGQQGDDSDWSVIDDEEELEA